MSNRRIREYTQLILLFGSDSFEFDHHRHKLRHSFGQNVRDLRRGGQLVVACGTIPTI
jgi:hypothetical protein